MKHVGSEPTRTLHARAKTHLSLVQRIGFVVLIQRKRSLRIRLLWPLLAVSASAAVVVAILSSLVGRQWAIHDVQERFDAIKQTIGQASFPLTTSVVASLANLSGTELITVDDRGDVQTSTFDAGLDVSLAAKGRSPLLKTSSVAEQAAEYQLGGTRYLAFDVVRPVNSVRLDNVSRVIVLFDESRVQAASRRAGLLPLVTGLSTIVLLTALLTTLTGRLAGRLSKLQRSVEKVADGDFESRVADDSTDEVGRLGQSVDKMATQLKQLWQQVNRQQSQKLLHQIAGGMAHQLRNALTGAQLALELHRQRCPVTDHQEIDVALREMEGATNYVRRLLLVGAGEQQLNEPSAVLGCLDVVRSTLAVVAKHLRVDLEWNLESELSEFQVADGSTFSAAISNLVLNALQAAHNVQVQTRIVDSNSCVVTVLDDGPGIDPSIAPQLCEPFVTTKPEGIGLGLPLVRRAAEKLSGQLEWRRQDNRTIFEFSCQLIPVSPQK